MIQNELNALLVQNGWYPKGYCACKGRPFRWTKGSLTAKLFSDRWTIADNIRVIRYGTNENALTEISEYLQNVVA